MIDSLEALFPDIPSKILQEVIQSAPNIQIAKRRLMTDIHKNQVTIQDQLAQKRLEWKNSPSQQWRQQEEKRWIDAYLRKREVGWLQERMEKVSQFYIHLEKGELSEEGWKYFRKMMVDEMEMFLLQLEKCILYHYHLEWNLIRECLSLLDGCFEKFPEIMVGEKKSFFAFLATGLVVVPPDLSFMLFIMIQRHLLPQIELFYEFIQKYDGLESIIEYFFRESKQEWREKARNMLFKVYPNDPNFFIEKKGIEKFVLKTLDHDTSIKILTNSLEDSSNPLQIVKLIEYSSEWQVEMGKLFEMKKSTRALWMRFFVNFSRHSRLVHRNWISDLLSSDHDIIFHGLYVILNMSKFDSELKTTSKQNLTSKMFEKILNYSLTILKDQSKNHIYLKKYWDVLYQCFQLVGEGTLIPTKILSLIFQVCHSPSLRFIIKDYCNDCDHGRRLTNISNKSEFLEAVKMMEIPLFEMKGNRSFHFKDGKYINKSFLISEAIFWGTETKRLRESWIVNDTDLVFDSKALFSVPKEKNSKPQASKFHTHVQNNESVLRNKPSWNLLRIQWKRIVDVINLKIEDAGLFPNDSISNIQYDQISQCYLPNSENLEQALYLASLFPAKLTPIFQNCARYQVGSSNSLFLWNNKRNSYTEIMIDDLIPCFPFAGSVLCETKTHDAWILLLQKALAKFYGSFAELTRTPISVLLTTLIGPVECEQYGGSNKDITHDQIRYLVESCEGLLVLNLKGKKNIDYVLVRTYEKNMKKILVLFDMINLEHFEITYMEFQEKLLQLSAYLMKNE